MSRRLSRLSLSAALLGVLACAGVAQPATTQPVAVRPAGGVAITEPQPPLPGGDLERFIRTWQTDTLELEGFYNLPWWEEGAQRIRRADAAWLERLEGVDFEQLGPAGRVDYLLLRNHLIARLERARRWEQRLSEMEPLLPFRRDLLKLADAMRRMEPVRPREAATMLAAWPELLKQLRARIEQGRRGVPSTAPSSAGAPVAPPTTAAPASSASGAAASPLLTTPVIARRAAGAVDRLRGTLHEWYEHYAGYQPDFAWWVSRPYEEAREALSEYGKYLREEVAGLKGKDDDPLIGDPIGPEGLAIDLAEEFLAYTPDELIEIGRREMAWCEEQMRQTAREMDLGDDWKAALARVKEDHVPPGEQDELVAGQARQAIAFLRTHDLLTIPPLCEETWRVVMLTPERQRVLPFQAYGGQSILVGYPTSTMKHEDKLMSMRGNNRHFTRITTPHELIPGHHLQAFMSQRHRPYRQGFSTPFFVEGWAVYWELRLWELPFAESPQDRMGMLFWRLHRCARIIVSLKFHLGQMSPAEMVDFLVDRVGHERFTATAEVRRYVGEEYSPLYQCGYLIGALQLRALRREVLGDAPPPGSERRFHDRLLTFGPIPIELIRAEMLELPLRRDARPSWRFDSPR